MFPFFVVFDVISFYKHNMYRNSTQTIMIFFISEYSTFVIIIIIFLLLNCPHEPAHIRTTMQLVNYYCSFVIFTHKKHKLSGLFRLPCMCACISVCVLLKIYTFYRTCLAGLFNGIYRLLSVGRGLCSGLVWYLHWGKKNEVGRQGWKKVERVQVMHFI